MQPIVSCRDPDVSPIDLEEASGIDAIGCCFRHDRAARDIDPAMLCILVVRAVESIGSCRKNERATRDRELILRDDAVSLRAGDRECTCAPDREVCLREDRPVDRVPIIGRSEGAGHFKGIAASLCQSQKHLVGRHHIDRSSIRRRDVCSIEHDLYLCVVCRIDHDLSIGKGARDDIDAFLGDRYGVEPEIVTPAPEDVLPASESSMRVAAASS